jgi:hypothetical protein
LKKNIDPLFERNNGGVAIRKAIDAMNEPDLTDEEIRIACEIENLMFRI